MVVISAIGWFLGEYYYEGGGMTFLGGALIFSGISGFKVYWGNETTVGRDKETNDKRFNHFLKKKITSSLKISFKLNIFYFIMAQCRSNLFPENPSRLKFFRSMLQ